MAAITVQDLTEGALTGTGVFDQLMRATKAHLEEEYSKSRIKGGEYATVYLGALQSVMNQSLQYLLQEQRTDLEAQLLQEQIETERLNQVQVAQQTENLVAQKAQVEAQTALSDQQRLNLQAEALNIPKQGELLDAQTAQTEASAALEARRLDLVAEQVLVAKEEVKIAIAKLANIPKEGALLDQQKIQLVAETGLTNQKTVNLQAEKLNIPKQGYLLDAQTDVQLQQKLNLQTELTHTESKTALVDQQTVNAITENDVMLKQICKLEAEFDLLMEQKLKTISETGLLNQKKATEQAQVSGVGVDPNSVIGKQKTLYTNQANGYVRDAEQKAAKLMSDHFNVMQTTQGGMVGRDYGLSEEEIKSVINLMRTNIGA